MSLLPKPRSQTFQSGTFTPAQLLIHAATSEGESLSKLFLSPLKAQISPSLEEANLHLITNPLTEQPEEYKLIILPDRIEVHAPQPVGWFYALQTLYQLFAHSGPHPPCQTILDHPEFQWRGVHLDVCRHFFPLPFLKKLLDLAALHKLNTFHWHLTEDQGWRLPVPNHPLLTEVSAWRTEADGSRYGGHYTCAEIEELVAYAAERFITIVPEVELPGHSLAALAAYPHLACQPRDFQVETQWGIFDDVYCAGNEDTFTFLEEVLTETLRLFPSPFIHIGGDECPKTRWQSCPKCQARMKAEGLANEDELQSWFIKRIVAFLQSKGRQVIGWDEILEGGLAPGAAVMSWQGAKGGIQAARQGHPFVMTPTAPCYFDFRQADDESEPGFHGVNTLHDVYHFQPIPSDLNPTEAQLILGGQANIWTERMTTPEEVEFMILPRLCALSEVLWNPTQRSWPDFQNRLPSHLEHLTTLNYTHRPLRTANL